MGQKQRSGLVTIGRNDAGIHHLGGYLRNGLDVQFEDEDWPEPNGREQRHEARGSMGSIVLLDLMGGVALLLWGLHMVRSGIMRAFGCELRRALSTRSAKISGAAGRNRRYRAPTEQHGDRPADDVLRGAWPRRSCSGATSLGTELDWRAAEGILRRIEKMFSRSRGLIGSLHRRYHEHTVV